MVSASDVFGNSFDVIDGSISDDIAKESVLSGTVSVLQNMIELSAGYAKYTGDEVNSAGVAIVSRIYIVIPSWQSLSQDWQVESSSLAIDRPKDLGKTLLIETLDNGLEVVLKNDSTHIYSGFGSKRIFT